MQATEGIRRRGSLNDFLQNVRARYSKDGLGSEDNYELCHPISVRRSSKSDKESITSVAPPICHTPPPRLDVLCELPNDGLVRTSTFRSSLEKAVEDINDKYKENMPPKRVPHILRIDTRSPPLSGNVTFPRFATRPPAGRPPAHLAGSLRGTRMPYRPICIDPAYSVMKQQELPEGATLTNPFVRSDFYRRDENNTATGGRILDEDRIVVELPDTSLSCLNQTRSQSPSPAPPSPQRAAQCADDDISSKSSSVFTMVKNDEKKNENGPTDDYEVSDVGAAEADDESPEPVSEDSGDSSYEDPFGDLQAAEVEEPCMSGAAGGSTPPSSSPIADCGADDANDIQGIGNREFMIQDYAPEAFDGIEMQRNAGYRTSSAPSVAELVNKFRRMQHLPEAPVEDSETDTVCLIDKLCQRQGSSTSYEDVGQVSSGDEGSLTDAVGRERNKDMPHPYGAF